MDTLLVALVGTMATIAGVLIAGFIAQLILNQLGRLLGIKA